MHHINCSFCGTKLKIKKIPEGKESLRLKCPKCMKIFTIDLSTILDKKPHEPETVANKPKTNGISEDYLDELLSSTKKEPAPQAKKEKPISNLSDLVPEEPKDIFAHEKPQELYSVIKANGKRLGPMSYVALLQKVKDGEVIGIDTIETQSGLRKPPISFIEIKRILQEKIREQNMRSEDSLGIDMSYGVRKEKRKVTLYLLLALLGIMILIYALITVPGYFKSEPGRQADSIEEPAGSDSEKSLASVETPDKEESAVSEEKTVKIINFSDESIRNYFSASGSYYRDATNHLRSRNYSETQKDLDYILLSSGSNPTTILLKLQVYLMSGELEKGFDDFQTMITVPALQDDIYINLGFGVINTMLGNFDDAKTHIERTRFVEPNNPFILFYSSILEYRQKEYDRAIQYMQDAIDNSPSDFIFLRDMRNMLREFQKTKEAS